MALTMGGFMALNGTISGQQLTSFVLYTVRDLRFGASAGAACRLCLPWCRRWLTCPLHQQQQLAPP